MSRDSFSHRVLPSVSQAQRSLHGRGGSSFILNSQQMLFEHSEFVFVLALTSCALIVMVFQLKLCGGSSDIPSSSSASSSSSVSKKRQQAEPASSGTGSNTSVVVPMAVSPPVSVSVEDHHDMGTKEH